MTATTAHQHLFEANTLYAQARHAEAVAQYDHVLSVDPSSIEALHNRAASLQALNRFAEALASCDAALNLAPQMAELYQMRGSIYQAMGQDENALADYDRAIALKPGLPHANNNSASILASLKRYDDALARCDAILAIHPDFAEAHANRANALLGFQRFPEARASVDRAIALQPNFAEAYSDRGNILQRLDRYDDALASYDRAITLNPHYAEAHNNRGFLLQFMGHHAPARDAYDRAIACDPTFARAYFNKATDLLLHGEFSDGWKLYEYRWQQSDQKSARNFAAPLWLGEEDLRGKTILLHAEQGFGDAIQFCRFVPMIEALGANVILEVPPPLTRLIATLAGSYQLVTKGDALPACDYHCPLLSLPLALKISLGAIPHDMPYLRVPATSRAKWQALLGAEKKVGEGAASATPPADSRPKRIGLTWSGAAGHKNDHHRSLPLTLLQPLLSWGAQRGYTFHSLQKEIRETDLPLLGGMHLHSAQLQDFGDTAALIEAMDLIISVDTSAVHLAGALAKPVWVMLPFAPDYRWLLDRADSPWYPTARLFRQPAIGDWQSVISAVLSALTEH